MEMLYQSALIYAGAVPDLILDPRLPAPTLYLSLLWRTQKISTCIYCARSGRVERERKRQGASTGGCIHRSRDKKEKRAGDRQWKLRTAAGFLFFSARVKAACTKGL